MSRARRAVLLGGLIGSLVGLVASSAGAVAGFSTPQRATRDGCYNSITTLSSTGARHGFLTCWSDSGPRLFYVSAVAGASSWSLQRVTAATALLAATDDGSTAYAVYTSGNNTYLTKHRHGGGTTIKRLTAHAAASAAIVARQGEWWAVWSRSTNQTSGSLCFYLFQSKTIGANQNSADLHRCGQEPSLTFGSNGKPILVSRRAAMDYGGDIELARWNGGWSKPTKLNGRDPGRLPFVEHDGTVTRVAWFHLDGNFTYDVALATKRGTGSWQRKGFTRHMAFDNAVRTRPPTIAVSSGTTFLAWNAVKANNKEVARVMALRNGTWSGLDVGDGTTGDAVFADLDAVNGRAYLVLDHSLANDSHTVTRHQ